MVKAKDAVNKIPGAKTARKGFGKAKDFTTSAVNGTVTLVTGGGDDVPPGPPAVTPCTLPANKGKKCIPCHIDDKETECVFVPPPRPAKKSAKASTSAKKPAKPAKPSAVKPVAKDKAAAPPGKKKTAL